MNILIDEIRFVVDEKWEDYFDNPPARDAEQMEALQKDLEYLLEMKAMDEKIWETRKRMRREEEEREKARKEEKERMEKEVKEKEKEKEALMDGSIPIEDKEEETENETEESIKKEREREREREGGKEEGDTGRFEITPVVPVGGLIMARFHSLQVEMETILELSSANAAVGAVSFLFLVCCFVLSLSPSHPLSLTLFLSFNLSRFE